jgi:hypothetical protein
MAPVRWARAAPAAQCARIRQARRQCDRQHRHGQPCLAAQLYHGRHAQHPAGRYAGLPWQRQVRPRSGSSMPMA